MLFLGYYKQFGIFILFFLILFALAIPYYSGDVKNHYWWAKGILSYGPNGFFEHEIPGYYTPNYPPVIIWFFTGSLLLHQLTLQVAWFLNNSIPFFPSKIIPFLEWENVLYASLKIPAIVAHIMIAFGLYYLHPLFKEKTPKWKRLVIAGVFLLNPATLYLSVLWGQIDIVPLMFLLFMLYSLFRKHLFISIFLLVLALLSKQTTVIFTPLFLYLILMIYGLKKLVWSLLLVIILLYLFYIPFYGFLFSPVTIYAQSLFTIEKSVGENTLNFWGFVTNFNRLSDEALFLDFNLQTWGVILWISTLGLPIYRFLRHTISLKEVLVFIYIVSISYFMFITRLHERHLAPAILFATPLVFIDKKFIPCLFYLSFLYMVNLYRGFFQPDIGIFNIIVSSIFYQQILVVGFFITLVYSIYLYLSHQEYE